MRSRNNLFIYQNEGVSHLNSNPRAMLFSFLGSGKSVMTLTSIVDRMNAGQVSKVLIVAPLRVCYAVWEKEAKKWQHTNHLRFSVLHGPHKKKALFSSADIYLINYEGLNWLTEVLLKYYVNKPIPFQMAVYDELTLLKNSQSVRMKVRSKREIKDVFGNPEIEVKKGWRNIMNKFSYTVGLTGTPAPNGYIDLFGQYLVIDGGKRLGEYITQYRDAYFKTSYNGWGYEITDLGKTAIEHKVSDITLCMNNARDYLDLPDVIVKNMFVELPPKARKLYDEMEKEMFIELDNGVEVEVFNKASLTNKSLQIATGDMYTDLKGNFEHIHSAKLEALGEVLEEAGGQPILVAYNFTVTANKIMSRFKKYKPVNMTVEKSSKTEHIIDQWNSGKIKLMVCHPKSAAHGIDGLQESGSIVVWMGATWNLEYYLQLNARLDRTGQKNVVSVIRILAEDTIDLAVADAIDHKFDTQEGLKNSLQKYRKGFINKELEVSFA